VVEHERRDGGLRVHHVALGEFDADVGRLDARVGTPCALVKPNLAELAGVIGRRLGTLSGVIDAAGKLRRGGWRSVLVSMGPRGAVLLAEDVCYGPAPMTEVRNTVGAGDALLAGFLSAGGRGAAALAEGLAWARAAVQSTDTLAQAVTDGDRRAVQVTADPGQHRRVGGLSGLRCSLCASPPCSVRGGPATSGTSAR